MPRCTSGGEPLAPLRPAKSIGKRYAKRSTQMDSASRNSPGKSVQAWSKEASWRVFCAVVGTGTTYERTYLRFVPADADWHPATDTNAIERELGTCLRFIECEETTPVWCPPIYAKRSTILGCRARRRVECLDARHRSRELATLRAAAQSSGGRVHPQSSAAGCSRRPGEPGS